LRGLQHGFEMISKSNERTRRAAWILIFALSFGALANSVATPQQQRERRVSTVVPAQASPSPTPRIIVPSVAPTPVASPTPAQTPTPQPTPALPAPRTLAELRARIREMLDRPEIAPALVAVKVASLDTGALLFEENSGQMLRPASNMKLYTIAAALDRLSPDYRFRTSIYSVSRPNASGVLKGDLIVYGRGDPSFSKRFYQDDPMKAMDELAASIAAAGVHRVEGNLVGDETYFAGSPLGSGWEWEDLTWDYGAEVSALTANDNSVQLIVKPSATLYAPCTITTNPNTYVLGILNHTTTSPAGTKRNLAVYRAPGSNVLEVGGSLPLGGEVYRDDVGFSNPARFFVERLFTALARRGIVVTGKLLTMNAQNFLPDRPPPVEVASGQAPGLPTYTSVPLIEIASRLSPPFSEIAAQTLKPSQNLYTELILRTLGTVVPRPVTAVGDPPRTNEEAGLEVVKAFLQEVGVDDRTIVRTDGSGLSRNDMVTADATLKLLTFMSRHRYGEVFRNALPIAGVDGTLRTRMRGTPAAGNVRAKTGTLSSAISLSGYVTSAAGERLVFSIMVNNFPPSLDVRRDYVDAIAVLLASFSGRTNSVTGEQ